MVVRIGVLSLVKIWSAGFDKLGLKREGGDQAYWCVWMGGVYVRARDPSVLTDGYETTVHRTLFKTSGAMYSGVPQIERAPVGGCEVEVEMG